MPSTFIGLSQGELPVYIPGKLSLFLSARKDLLSDYDQPTTFKTVKYGLFYLQRFEILVMLKKINILTPFIAKTRQ